MLVYNHQRTIAKVLLLDSLLSTILTIVAAVLPVAVAAATAVPVIPAIADVVVTDAPPTVVAAVTAMLCVIATALIQKNEFQAAIQSSGRVL